LLKTLGASAGFMLRTMVIEFALLGLLAGAIGTLGALGIGWGLAKWVLDMPYEPSWLIPLSGVVSGALGVTLIGMIMVGRALQFRVVRGLSESL
jgi:putative ABC transport system permease protein